ncbi:MAG: hypothetical protein WAM39_19415 [Bryobacteraceae bacterium]
MSSLKSQALDVKRDWEDLNRKINSSSDLIEGLPLHSIVAWFDKNGPIPKNWHVCDGTPPTPDLRGLFVLGTDSLADSGSVVGDKDLTQDVVGEISTARSAATDPKNTGDHTDNQATGFDHYHKLLNAHTVSVPLLPRSMKLVYIMRVR